MVSGLFGGFTGSYIFSQTIFNLRAGESGQAVLYSSSFGRSDGVGLHLTGTSNWKCLGRVSTTIMKEPVAVQRVCLAAFWL